MRKGNNYCILLRKRCRIRKQQISNHSHFIGFLFPVQVQQSLCCFFCCICKIVRISPVMNEIYKTCCIFLFCQTIHMCFGWPKQAKQSCCHNQNRSDDATRCFLLLCVQMKMFHIPCPPHYSFFEL